MSVRKLPAMTREEAMHLADMLSLPFIVPDREPTTGAAGRRGFWRDANTGDFGADNETGFAWARRLREYYSRHPSASPILGLIVRDMMSLGKIGGVEVGFLDTLDLWASRRTLAGGGP